MRTSTVGSASLRGDARLDAGYFLSPGIHARVAVARAETQGLKVRRVGDVGSVAPGTRTKRLYAGEGETGLSYLRPYDVFDYFPQAADQLVIDGTSEALRPSPGTILQTCSGRNLGPLAYADAYLSEFAISDDMLRLTVPDEAMRMYVLAFLSTALGQSLLRVNKTGAVIDHLSGADLESVGVPIFESATFDRVVALMRQAVKERERARLDLKSLVTELESRLGPIARGTPLRDGFATSAGSIGARMDVAYHDPVVGQVRARLAEAGGRACHEFARPVMPPRYIRVYVEEDYGKPVISGRQLGQTRPINLKYLAHHSIDAAVFGVREGWTVFGGEGRAEERLGLPSMVTRERDGWLASEHVMRIVPNDEIEPGWVFLAFATGHVQLQVKAVACGSVIDELQPADVGEVILPPYDAEAGRVVSEIWSRFDSANLREVEAQGILNQRLQALADA